MGLIFAGKVILEGDTIEEMAISIITVGTHTTHTEIAITNASMRKMRKRIKEINNPFGQIQMSA